MAYANFRFFVGKQTSTVMGKWTNTVMDKPSKEPINRQQNMSHIYRRRGNNLFESVDLKHYAV